MKKGRLVYIEPNDIVKDHFKLSNNNHKNFTWNPEDLNLYVDLQVVCPSRNDCGEEQKTSENGTYSNTYISLMEGKKINGNGTLTTDYTNISYSEIRNNDVSSKEALGITSIDITFDAHFYPKVTMNFTDVRAYSLFMPAEEEYKEGLKTEAYESFDKDGNRKYYKSGRAYTNFFSAVFHFPYPRFLLTVKGFYGTKVTFILAVETFKSSLNANTGNFDVSINFIGYMYGIYTDIPMNYIMCAPYIGELDYSNTEGMVKSKYWNQQVAAGIFLTKQGQTIPTFLELAKNYSKALTNINVDASSVGSNFVTINNLKFLISDIDTIKQNLQVLVLSDFGFNEDNKQQYTTVINNGKKYCFFIFVKSDDKTDIEVKWSTSKTKALSELITKTNSRYSDILGTNLITMPWLCDYIPTVSGTTNGEILAQTTGSVIGKLDQVVGIDTSGEIVKKEDALITTIKVNNDSGSTYSYNIGEEDTNTLVNYVKSNKSKGILADLDKYYFCAINLPELVKKLDDLKKLCEDKVKETEKTATSEIEDYLSQQLGFTPNIENVFRMIFAHLQCFFHEFLENTLYEIKKSNRKIKNFTPKLDNKNTDVKYKSETGDTFLPPFFGFYETNSDQQKEIAYPSYYDIKEITLVEDLINAAKQYSQQYNKLVQEIEALTATGITASQEEPTVAGGFPLPIAFSDGFTPSSYYDAFYGNKNPYSYIDRNSDTFLKDIFYLFSIRYYALTMLFVKTSQTSFIENEVANVLAYFPDLEQEAFKKPFGDYIDNKKKSIYDIINEHSKTRIVPIEKMDIPNTSYLRELLLLARTNIGTTCTDEERKTMLTNQYVNTFEYLRGVKVVDNSYFDVFNQLTTTVKNLTDIDVVYNNIEYIIKNENAGNIPVHKIYRLIKQETTVQTYTCADVPQLPMGDECNKYTLPFILWTASIPEDKKYVARNLLHDLGIDNLVFNPNNDKKRLTFHTISDQGKSFYILSSLLANVSEVRDSFASAAKGSSLDDKNGNDLFPNRITRTRKIIPLFYGCLLYLTRKKLIDGVDIVPHFFNNDTIGDDKVFEVRYDIYDQVNDVIINDNTGIFKLYCDKDKCSIGNLMRHLVCIHSLSETYDFTTSSGLTNGEIKEIFAAYGNNNTALEEMFLSEVRAGGILKEIIENAKAEHDLCQKYIIKLPSTSHIYGNIPVFPLEGKTSKAVVRLMSETVCMISTNYRSSSLQSAFNEVLKLNLGTFYDKLYAKSISGTTTVDTTTSAVPTDNTINTDTQRSLYYTLKNLYDKWICSYGSMDRFTLKTPNDDDSAQKSRYKTGIQVNNKSEINNFLFVDSLYNDIGEKFIINPASIIRLTQSSFDGTYNFSLYQYMHLLCQENKLMMRAIPVYNNFYTESGLKEIFTPLDVFNANQAHENGFSSTYLIMYTHQPSAHLDVENSSYINDGMDLGRTIITSDTLKLFNNEDGYPVPTFGVTYGMQNQNYFKGININMDNPMTTDYSIANTLILANTSKNSGDLNMPLGIGQNIYSIYSNRSYNCTVEMMGCANIMPMMYFQLNNIPMFKGVYMIVSVKHSISGGNMTTTFTGIRQTSIIYPFVNNSLILSSMLDRSNGPISNSPNPVEPTPGNNPNVAVLTPKVYNDITITLASLLDDTWMSERRADYIKKHPEKKLSNMYWGSPNKNNKHYPLGVSKNRKIEYIILHYTAGTQSANKGTAIGMRNGWFLRWHDNNVGASADFGVDDHEIVQFTPNISEYSAWSCGGNNKGISIEMCSTYDASNSTKSYGYANQENWGFSQQVLNNTKKLIIELFKEVGAKNITTHYRRDKAAKKTSPKPCPGIWGWNEATKLDRNGVQLKMGSLNAIPVKNDESELIKFVNEIRAEWARVAGISLADATGMINIV